MMKKLLSLAMLITIALFTVACGTSNNEQDSTSGNEDEGSSEDQGMVMPEVEVQFEEQPLPVQQKTTIQAHVTQENENVDDADSVEFEIWKDSDGKDSSQMMEATHTSDGIYEIKHTFESAGTYQVIAHTTAREMHVMPQVKVMVGQEEAGKAEEKSSENHADEHGHGSGEFMVDFMTDMEYKAGEETQLMATINQKEKPFEDGFIRFEISSEQMENHAFIEAEESKAGKYTKMYTFPSAGEYKVTVHYEKPDQEIHGHKEFTIEVTN